MLINNLIVERINQPLVMDVYGEWCFRGLDREVNEVISGFSEDVRAPFELAFTTHVYKEKGLFLDLIGKELGVPENARLTLASSADVLWALSLMIDDIQDGDIVRGGNETSWFKYGKSETEVSAYSVLNSLLKRIHEVTGDLELVQGCSNYIQLGVRSLEEHRTMDLNTPIGMVVANYENRCDFHATFQILAYAHLLGENVEPKKIHDFIMALRLINQSGQLANDLKGFWRGDTYGRGFSDFQNGVPTVPLMYMYRELDAVSQKRLLQMFGSRGLSTYERHCLAQMVESSGVVGRTKARIRDNHSVALSILKENFNEDGLKWFEDWVRYKESLLE